MNRCRLIYRSCSTKEIPSNKALLSLAEESAKNNERDGITGLLVLSGSHFLQVLEGPSNLVNALFQRICRDSRHHTIELIQFEAAAESYFEDWNMRLVDLHDLTMEPRRLLMDKYAHEDGSVIIPDQLHLAFALLLDAKAICLNEPWKN